MVSYRIRVKARERQTGKLFDLIMIDFNSGICKVKALDGSENFKTIPLYEVEIKFIREEQGAV